MNWRIGIILMELLILILPALATSAPDDGEFHQTVQIGRGHIQSLNWHPGSDLLVVNFAMGAWVHASRFWVPSSTTTTVTLRRGITGRYEVLCEYNLRGLAGRPRPTVRHLVPARASIRSCAQEITRLGRIRLWMPINSSKSLRMRQASPTGAIHELPLQRARQCRSGNKQGNDASVRRWTSPLDPPPHPGRRRSRDERLAMERGMILLIDV